MSRRVLVLTLATALFAASAHAGVPAPQGATFRCEFICGPPPFPPGCRSVAVLNQPPLGCQFRFNQMGNLDELCLLATLRDSFGTPQVGMEARAALLPADGSTVLCSCDDLEGFGVAGAGGVVEFEFSRLGGRGQLEVLLSVREDPQDPWSAICAFQVPFTSPDLNASCDPGNAAVATVVDLGLWAAGLPPGYVVASDYNCDGTVNVVDLGLWASGTVPGTCAP